MNEVINVRIEQETDVDAVRKVVKEAFAGAEHSDGDEHNLVDRLRHSAEFVKDLSLVAEADDRIVGYIMFSRIRIGHAEALALAPLAVLPEYQNLGIGRTLIHTGHKVARDKGYSCSVVLGAPEYYNKCGYLQASLYGIRAPFEVPHRFYMVCPLNPPIPDGVVCYSPAFDL